MNQDWRVQDLSPLALAFVGDAIWEVYARGHCLNQGIRKPHELHQMATRYVSAKAQERALFAIADQLTEGEAAIARRGRNAKSAHVRRNVDIVVYRHSTGFEALIGYLYGSGQTQRLEALVQSALQALDQPAKESQE